MWSGGGDSTTTRPPLRQSAAIKSLGEPIWLLAGGRDKGLAFGPLMRTMVRRCRGAAFYGEVRQALAQQATALEPGFPCTAVETLDEAFAWCFERSEPGEAILLSPGCASTDQFANYQQRGEHFVELVRARIGGRPRP